MGQKLRHLSSKRLSFVQSSVTSGVKSEMIDQLGGWANKTVGQGYGTGYELEKLSMSLSEANFPL